VRWFLSLRHEDLPAEAARGSRRSYRCIKISGEPFEFTDNFQDLHTRVYEEVLKGNGFKLEENRNAIEIVYEIRNTKPSPKLGEMHSLCQKIK
jgi:UDP-N-acetyl-2-amino-2-deoxyglucuronate dehydrogenase